MIAVLISLCLISVASAADADDMATNLSEDSSVNQVNEVQYKEISNQKSLLNTEALDDVNDGRIIDSSDVELLSSSDSKTVNESNEIISQSSEDSFLKVDDDVEHEVSLNQNNDSNNYGYWVLSSDMKKLDLDDLSKHGVTDLFLNYYAHFVHIS